MGYFAAYKSMRSIVAEPRDEEQCLRFYYYMTSSLQNASMSVRIHPESETISSETIVTVRSADENKWSYSETAFIPRTDEYYVREGRARGLFPPDLILAFLCRSIAHTGALPRQRFGRCNHFQLRHRRYISASWTLW